MKQCTLAVALALVIVTSASVTTQVRLKPDTTVAARPVHTYSIVARDPATGQLGVAVQSHWFSVGSVVPWAEAGVGAVATQSFVDPSYGKNGLDLMRGGTSAPDALKMLLAKDQGRDVRQVAMIDARGRVAAHTGAKDIPAAGHIAGMNFSVQANLMLNETVWPAMAKAFATEMAQRAVDDAIQLIGGRGLLADHPVDRLYRAVRALRIYEGTTEIQQLIIAGELLR